MKIEVILREEVERVLHERLGGRRYARLHTERAIDPLLELAVDKVRSAGQLRLRVLAAESSEDVQRWQCYRCAQRVLTQRVIDRGINQVTTSRKYDVVMGR